MNNPTGNHNRYTFRRVLYGGKCGRCGMTYSGPICPYCTQ